MNWKLIKTAALYDRIKKRKRGAQAARMRRTLALSRAARLKREGTNSPSRGNCHRERE